MEKQVQKYSTLDKTIVVVYPIMILINFIYLIYYKFIGRHVISSFHFKIRQFIFWNGIREIIVLFILIGILHSIFIVFNKKKYSLLIISVVVLIIQILLFSQLQIQKGP
jgi:hypothetical protein